MLYLGYRPYRVLLDYLSTRCACSRCMPGICPLSARDSAHRIDSIGDTDSTRRHIVRRGVKNFPQTSNSGGFLFDHYG